MDKKYDIVIIGSGLGGLLCGAILSKNGYSVCILEKHFQLGGNMQTFKRKGCNFSGGMHFIGAMDKDQILYKLLNYIDVADKIHVQKLDEKAFQRLCFKDEEYTYAMGMENFKNNLISYFPDERLAIETYTNKIQEIWNAIDILNLRDLSEDYASQADAVSISAYEFINSLTTNERLRSVLAATNGLYAGEKDKTPLHVHALINCFYINSAYKLDEREVTFADALAESITNKGGTIIKKQEVVNLQFDGENITAAETKDGQIYYGKNFISNIHPVSTIKLAGESNFRKAFVSRIKDLKNSVSSFGLYIVLKKNTFKDINSDVYYFNDDNVWGIDSYDSAKWPEGYVLYTTPDKDNEEYAESITILTFMKYEDVKQWENTTIGKRGDEYLAFKKEKAEKLLDLASQKFPILRETVDSYFTSTPLTYRDYTGIPEGSMYGVQKDYKNHLNSFLIPRTKIPNLFLTGQNIQMHGILGVSMCVLHTCSIFLDYNKLIGEIRNA